jgi:hypothetical protein
MLKEDWQKDLSFDQIRAINPKNYSAKFFQGLSLRQTLYFVKPVLNILGKKHGVSLNHQQLFAKFKGLLAKNHTKTFKNDQHVISWLIASVKPKMKECAAPKNINEALKSIVQEAMKLNINALLKNTLNRVKNDAIYSGL